MKKLLLLIIFVGISIPLGSVRSEDNKKDEEDGVVADGEHGSDNVTRPPETRTASALNSCRACENDGRLGAEKAKITGTNTYPGASNNEDVGR